MSDKKSRVRWTQQEKQAVAASMRRMLVSTPKLSKLQAVIHAQNVLPPGRRRSILSWASVEPILQPFLDAPVGAEPDASAPAGPSAGTDTAQVAVDDEPPLDPPQPEPVAEPQSVAEARTPQARPPVPDTITASSDTSVLPDTSASAPAQRLARALDEAAGALAELFAQRLAESMGRALSPDMLNGLLSPDTIGKSLERAMAQVRPPAATPTAAADAPAAEPAAPEAAAPAPSAELAPPASTREPQASEPTSPEASAPAPEASVQDAPVPAPPARPAVRPRVLVAGLQSAHADELREAMHSQLDLRFWRPGESREQLKAASRGCAVAVLMADATDHSVEQELKSLMLRPIRHTGNLAALRRRLTELVEHNLFGMLGS